MNATAVVNMSEWETLHPENCAELRGRFLDSSKVTRQHVQTLTERKLLRLTELRDGLRIESYSHVGRVRIGDLTIAILPKLKGSSLLHLLRYAYGLRRLHLLSDVVQGVDQCGFEDLLISQLNAEVQELLSRGLRREYIRTSERLSLLRGKLDLTRIAVDGGRITASLPCQHYPREEDTLLNRVLVAGLQLAGSMASTLELRRDCRRLSALMEENVSPIRLSPAVLDRAGLQMNRLTTAYAPATSIIQMLVNSQGVVLGEKGSESRLPGFLFDMNSFFQSLIARFLRDNLSEYSVSHEHGLKGMMRYNSEFNPRRRRSPTPRPDYVVLQRGRVRSILDAKYRDLWANSLPPEMLYQLVVYAISQPESPQSSILYPTSDERAKEARIDVTDPVVGRALGEVCLRPVHLPSMETMVVASGAKALTERQGYARGLALGR